MIEHRGYELILENIAVSVWWFTRAGEVEYICFYDLALKPHLLHTQVRELNSRLWDKYLDALPVDLFAAQFETVFNMLKNIKITRR